MNLFKSNIFFATIVILIIDYPNDCEEIVGYMVKSTQHLHLPSLSFQENLYEQFLVQQFNKVLETSQMLVVLQPLSMSAEDRKVIHNKLFKKGIKLALHSNTVVR